LLVEHAFEILNLNRVWLHVYEFNERGIRTYERVGFQKEGVLRQDHFHDGRYWSTIIMGILREEWQAAKKATPWGGSYWFRQALPGETLSGTVQPAERF